MTSKMDKMIDNKNTTVMRDVKNGQAPQPAKRGQKKNENVLVRQMETTSMNPDENIRRSLPELDDQDGNAEVNRSNSSHAPAVVKQSKSGFSLSGMFGKKKKHDKSSGSVSSDKEDASSKPKDVVDVHKKDKKKDREEKMRKSDSSLERNKDTKRSEAVAAVPQSKSPLRHQSQPPQHHHSIGAPSNPQPRMMSPPVTQQYRQPVTQAPPVRAPVAPAATHDQQLSIDVINGSDVLPGTIGLFNHGNTCYLNSVMQCICHIDSIAHYFTSDLYLQDLNLGLFDKKGRKLPNEFRQEVTDAFAVLVKSIWQHTYEKSQTEQFREACRLYREDFAGKDQQDAMEFLLFLLDTLHEELNGYKRLKQNKSRVPPVVTDSFTFVEDHAQRNRSVIYQLFYAYQQSTLRCPHCQYNTTNVEPFTCLSLPIPAASTRAITVVYADQKGRQMRYGFVVNMAETVKFFRELVAEKWKIDAKNIVLCEIGSSGFHRTFRNSEPLSVVLELMEGCSLYAIHLPEAQLAEDSDTDSDDGPAYRANPAKMANGRKFLEQDLSFIRVVAVHCEKSDRHDELYRFSGPLHTEIHVQCTYAELKKALITQLEISGDLRNIPRKEDLDVEIHLIDAPQHHSLIKGQQRSLPLIGHAVDRALSYNQSDQGARHLKIVVHWKQADRVRFAVEYEDEVEIDSSVQLMNNAEMEKPVNLLDCLTAYMSPGQFEVEDAWMCPKCRRRQRVDQSIKLWNTPDVLILQLKRFQTSGARRNKLSMFVKFPVEFLDLTPFVEEHNVGHLNPYCLSSIGRDASTPADYLYDLVGVVNHTGSMQTGHYFSYIMNPSDHLWYRFSDTKVEALSDMTAVCSPSAYILVYQRRTLRPILSPNGQHWSLAGPAQPMMMPGGPPMQPMMMPGGPPMQPMMMPGGPPMMMPQLPPMVSQPSDDQIEGVQLRHPHGTMPPPGSYPPMMGGAIRPQQSIPMFPPQREYDEQRAQTTVKTGKATVHVPDSKAKKQGKWVWRGGQKVWDGPDPPPTE